MPEGWNISVTHHRLPLVLVVALVVILLTPSWITAQGFGDCFRSNCCSARADWQQRLWYADIYNFLYGDCNCYYANHGLYHPPYEGETADASAASAATDSPKPSGEDAANLMDEANVLYLTGSYEQAAELYAKAVNLDPTISKGWLNLGNCLYFLGRYQASLDAYEALLSRESDNANALAGKNNALLALERARTIQPQQ